MCPTKGGTVEIKMSQCSLGTLTQVLLSCRFQEKGNLEVLLFTIQSKLRANNQKPYVPHDGKLISDINKVEHQPEMFFRFYCTLLLAELSHGD